MKSLPRRALRAGTPAGLGTALTALAVAMTAIPTASADDTMRCGTRLVSEGDGKDKVRTLCGEPTSISLAGYVGGPGYFPNYYSVPFDYPYTWPGWTALPVEIWTYNLGPNKLLRKLRFVGDELDEIRTNGYGY
jgi:hypothetical protein